MRTPLFGFLSLWKPRVQGSTALKRSLAPALEIGKGRRRLKFPRAAALFPMRPELIHPGIASRVVAKRVAPALGYRNLKKFFISPLKKTKPKKRRLSRMLRGVSSK